jgi:hypothetical protein
VTSPLDDRPDPDAELDASGSADPARLRDEVEGVDALPVTERVRVFERVNEGIADELARLDEI